MVDRIGTESALAREALRAALERTNTARADSARASAAPDATPAQAPDFARALSSGIGEIGAKLDSAESLPTDLLTGKISDFHEIAVQLKSTELSFKFAMEIRNKLVDAYREIMRMSV